MRIIADLHIHSKFSRATSSQMDIENLTQWAKMKGIQLLGTGDFTHPLWLLELKERLKAVSYGLFEYNGINFMLTAEVCNIFSRAAKTHKIHNVAIVPDFESVDKINKSIEKYGNLQADGRPMLDMDAKDFVEAALSASDDCLIVPAHAWTPHFSVFGSNSGFDSLDECFQEFTKYIYAIETGLSSDPSMNWRLSRLDRICLTSNSDAHSPARIGREANVFDCKMDYKTIIDVIKSKDRTRFLYTIEFFPEEGKYHWDGHRNCNQMLSPSQSRALKGKCPKCGRPVTVGVMNRVEELADRPEGFILADAIPFKNLVPLDQIIANALGKGVETQAVQNEYKNLITKVGNEFEILLDIPEEKLRKEISTRIAEGIIRVRNKKINIRPGYDGEYGKISIFDEKETIGEKQLEMF